MVESVCTMQHCSVSFFISMLVHCWHLPEQREVLAVTLAGVLLGAILVISEIYQFIYAVPTYEVPVPLPAALLHAASPSCSIAFNIKDVSRADGRGALSAITTVCCLC